jgi:hypothetical protein
VKADSGASAPPATMASARPSRIACSATPMASDPAAHAVQTADEGPCRPSTRATAAAGALGSDSGTANGLTRSGPRSSSAR